MWLVLCVYMLHFFCKIWECYQHIRNNQLYDDSPEYQISLCLQCILGMWGMFKKRPNFLNSAPTSTESMLRLLSAPSIKLWQQTAICPIPVRALVVKLHPLNWARAQAVRRISDKVMKELEEQHIYMCVCVCVWNIPTNLVKIFRDISFA